mgnify:CR=1 FL=1
MIARRKHHPRPNARGYDAERQAAGPVKAWLSACAGKDRYTSEAAARAAIGLQLGRAALDTYQKHPQHVPVAQFGVAVLKFSTSRFMIPELNASRKISIEAPTAMAVLPRDVFPLPRKIVEQHANLQHWRVYSKGGHFGPAEAPQEYVEDVRRFFGRFRG